MKNTTITLSKKTWKKLNLLKNKPIDTFDSLINNLLNYQNHLPDMNDISKLKGEKRMNKQQRKEIKSNEEIQ